MDLRTKEQILQEEMFVANSIPLQFAIMPEGTNTFDIEGWLFSYLFEGMMEEVVTFHNKDIFDILVYIGAFKSKSEARKNWTKTTKDIPEGLNMFVVGKKKVPLLIWNCPKEFEICLNPVKSSKNISKP